MTRLGLDRMRVFNLGYFTWVERQGAVLEDFNVKRGVAAKMQA